MRDSFIKDLQCDLQCRRSIFVTNSDQFQQSGVVLRITNVGRSRVTGGVMRRAKLSINARSNGKKVHMQRKTEPNTSDQVAANSKKTGHMARNKRNQYKDSATVEVKVHMQGKTQPKTSEKGTANSKQTGQTARNTRN